MPYIKFGITQNASEWKIIEDAMQEMNKTSGRKQQVRGAGYSCHISMEISKVLKSINIDCLPDKEKKIRKNFQINISEENEKKLQIICDRMSITPSVLISQIILDKNKKIKSAIMQK